MGKNIALFGGTFDPVHIGHFLIAEAIWEMKRFDSILFVPSAQPPHKDKDILFTARDRFNMLSLAVKDNPHFVVSDIEMLRGGPSYTIDTIHEIKKLFSLSNKISFIVGTDNLYDIASWKNPEEIVDECEIIVASRICNNKNKIPNWLNDKVELVKVPLIEISSSDIRRRIKTGKSIRYRVLNVVFDYIQTIKKERN